jgi:hypothetical protein
MPIHFSCGKCSATYRVADAVVGLSLTCPACKTAMTVPAPDEVELPEAAPTPRTGTRTEFGPASPPTGARSAPTSSAAPVSATQRPVVGKRSSASAARTAPRPGRGWLIYLLVPLLLVTVAGWVGVYWLATQEKPTHPEAPHAVARSGQPTDDDSTPETPPAERTPSTPPPDPSPAHVLPTPDAPVPEENVPEPLPTPAPKAEPEPRTPDPRVPPANDNPKTTLKPVPKAEGVLPLEPAKPVAAVPAKESGPSVPATKVPEPPPAKAPPPSGTADIPELLKDLRSKDPKVRLAALVRARDLGEKAALAATPICNCLLDSQPKLRTAALDAIERVRPDLYKPLATLVLDTQYGNRLSAVRQLQQLGTRAVETRLVLYDQLQTVGNLCLNNLEGGNPELKEFGRHYLPLRPLIDAINSVEPGYPEMITIVKQLAVVSLDGVKVHKSLKPILEHATGADAVTFLHAWAGEYVTRRKELVPILKTSLDSRSKPAVLVALRMCGEYGELVQSLVPRIRQLKTSSDAETRETAKAVLDKLNDK